jgi:PAS domain S-box-containing protein
MTLGQSSIKNRVRAVILLTSITVLLATASAFIAYEIFSFRGYLVRHFSTLAAVMADDCAASLDFQQPSTAEDLLGALKAEPEIMAVAIYDADGNLFASYPRSLQTNLLPVLIEKQRTHRFAEDALMLFDRVNNKDGKTLGTLYMQTSLRGLHERAQRSIGILLVVLLGSVVLAFVLSAFLQKRITNPILALISIVKEVSDHRDFTVRAPKLTRDELGTLAESFNHMLGEIQGHQSRLAEQARLMDLSNDAIIVKDMKDRIVYWNRGAEELYGWSRADALGKVKHELLHTEFFESREDINAMLDRAGRWSGELVQTRRGGGRIYVSTRWALDRDADGKRNRILITDTDITERKAFQTKLEALVAERTAKLQETIGELESFSYSISHDMRAPLRAMHGYAQALQEDYGSKLDTEANHYLDRICRAATRLDALIQDVLAYSRISKGEIELHPVNLEQLIEDILPNYPEFQAPKAEILIQKPLQKVIGHEAYLTQCVTNLLGNAVKFVAPGVVPRVQIRTELSGGKVRIWFEDNGIGIDPSHRERIFQIFGQVYSGKKYPGTGIGLAIVRKAAQRMNGEAGVQSELGKGSRFWLSLNQAGNESLT